MSQEAQQYPVNMQELTTALLQHKKIHEGIWQLNVQFEWYVVNFDMNNTGPKPTAISQIKSFILERTTQLNAMSVDAAVVNPSSVILSPIDPFRKLPT